MKKLICCILSLLMLATPLFAQGATKNNDEPVSEAQAMLQESAQATQQTEEDTSISNESSQQRFEENPKYNIHEYNYKQQVIVGGSVMFCIILAMVANNNYNPKAPKK